MRIVGSNYENGRTQSCYYYRLHDDAPLPAVGDWLLHETREVTYAIEVIDEDEYRKRTTQDPLVLPEVKYVIDRSPERAAAERVRRVKEIRNTLATLQAKAQKREALEAQAAAGGEEGKKLLAELDELEAE